MANLYLHFKADTNIFNDDQDMAKKWHPRWRPSISWILSIESV